jgi:hypothetical protein
MGYHLPETLLLDGGIINYTTNGAKGHTWSGAGEYFNMERIIQIGRKPEPQKDEVDKKVSKIESRPFTEPPN